VVWDIRLPRTLLAVLVGAAMSLAGVGTQALVHNPLGDPYVLGVAQGASTAAVAVMVAGAGGFGGLSAGAAAFVGALATLIAVYAFARRGGGLGALRLVLSGVAVGYALSGVTSYLVLQADDPATTSSVLFWLLGSLGRAQWSYLGAPAVGLVLGMVWLFGRARAMNALQAGEETAASVGIRPGRVRAELFVVIALLTGLMVALCGWIGFVGLIVPHTAKLLIGANHRLLLPLAALLGAAFLVLVDLLARVALAPQELPIGVVTSVLGAPAFLLLMARRARDVSGR
jgi:iron complex transport system permease protein